MECVTTDRPCLSVLVADMRWPQHSERPRVIIRTTSELNPIGLFVVILTLFWQHLSDGLECDYFYHQAQCQVPNLAALMPGRSGTACPNMFFVCLADNPLVIGRTAAHSAIVPEIYLDCRSLR